MFSGNSNFVQGVDTAFMVILGISMIFLVAITAVMIYFLVRYSRKRNKKATYIDGSIKLEILWTVIPTILVMVMFWYGWKAYVPMRNIPDEGLKVEVTARMWSWSFKYPSGRITDSLYVPVGENVILDMKSTDVLHSLYVPAFRIKEDIVPGKKNELWFKALKTGIHDLFCTEYCGLQHSYMYTKVEVMEKAEFEKWYNDKSIDEAPGEMAGLTILKQKGCTACHTLDGSKRVGPSFKGVYGAERLVTSDGNERTQLADDDYITQSILDPNVDIVDGYKENQMVSYEGQLSDEEIGQIIEYLKSIK